MASAPQFVPHGPLKIRQARKPRRLGLLRRKPQESSSTANQGLRAQPFARTSLGNPRREAEGHTSTSVAQRSAVPARQRGSLDNSNQLATSFQEYLKLSETKWDAYRQKCWFQGVLLNSLQKIVDLLERRQEKLQQILGNPRMERFFIRHSKLDSRLQNELVRVAGKLERRQKEWIRLHNCQMEWIGFKATCCRTALAVPIGCNHRLCFLCNGHRAEKFRDRVRVMFDRLEHPLFLTLTVPNLQSLSKRRFSAFRVAWNKFRKQHKAWIKGGLFAIETTYNNQRDSKSYKTWHLHCHVLIDSAIVLPLCACHGGAHGKKCTFRKGCPFAGFLRRVEYDWFLLTGGRKAGWAPGDFDYWVREANRRDGSAQSHKFHAENRRIIHARRVTDRQKAAFEVLKYVTKASVFAHIPQAVEEFMTATRGTRMLQTFGTWYGFKFEDDVNDWSHLECACGQNKFERMPGSFFREGVVMDENGRWHLRVQVFERSMGPPGSTGPPGMPAFQAGANTSTQGENFDANTSGYRT